MSTQENGQGRLAGPKTRIVVTIFQNRRVALPHIFIKYALPEMRRIFPGTIDCVLIQHVADASGGRTELASLKGGTEGMKRVRAWTEAGKFDGAHILQHDVIHRPYPHVPSIHRGLQEALSRQADFHLWLEDDALVLDRSCSMWPGLFGSCEVGVYVPTPQHLHPAFMVSTPIFDARIIKSLENYAEWDWQKRRIEPWMRKQLKTPRAYLPRHYAVRDHPRTYPYTGIRYVVDFLRGFAPQAIELLEVDFGPGLVNARPVVHKDFRKDGRKEKIGWVNRYHRFRSWWGAF